MTLIDEYLALAEQIEAARARQDEIKAQLIDSHGTGKHTVDGHAVAITVPRILNKTAAAAKYPAAQYPQYYSLVFDGKKLAQDLSPNQLDALKDDGSARVTIK